MELLLENQEILDLGENLHSLSIACQVGCCWITQAGDSRDHILHSGDRFTVRGRGRILISALEPSRLQLVADNDQVKVDIPWQPRGFSSRPAGC